MLKYLIVICILLLVPPIHFFLPFIPFLVNAQISFRNYCGILILFEYYQAYRRLFPKRVYFLKMDITKHIYVYPQKLVLFSALEILLLDHQILFLQQSYNVSTNKYTDGKH